MAVSQDVEGSSPSGTACLASRASLSDALVKKHYIEVEKNGREIEMKIAFRSIEDEEDSGEKNVGEKCELLSKNRSPENQGIIRVCEGYGN